VSPVKYEMCFYIPEDTILHSHCRENFKSYKIMKRVPCCQNYNIESRQQMDSLVRVSSLHATLRRSSSLNVASRNSVQRPQCNAIKWNSCVSIQNL
jgi:hypothetical protein